MREGHFIRVAVRSQVIFCESDSHRTKVLGFTELGCETSDFLGRSTFLVLKMQYFLVDCRLKISDVGSQCTVLRSGAANALSDCDCAAH